MEARNGSGQDEGGISSHEEKQADLRHVSKYTRKRMATAWVDMEGNNKRSPHF